MAWTVSPFAMGWRLMHKVIRRWGDSEGQFIRGATCYQQKSSVVKTILAIIVKIQIPVLLVSKRWLCWNGIFWSNTSAFGLCLQNPAGPRRCKIPQHSYRTVFAGPAPLLTASLDRTARLWRTPEDHVLAHPAEVNSAKFNKKVMQRPGRKPKKMWGEICVSKWRLFFRSQWQNEML